MIYTTIYVTTYISICYFDVYVAIVLYLVDIDGNWHNYNINGGRGDDTFIVDGGW